MTRPSLTYSEAERVGLAVRRRWYGLTGKRRRPVLTEEQWADMAQLFMRLAGDEIEGRDE